MHQRKAMTMFLLHKIHPSFPYLPNVSAKRLIVRLRPYSLSVKANILRDHMVRKVMK